MMLSIFRSYSMKHLPWPLKNQPSSYNPHLMWGVHSGNGTLNFWWGQEKHNAFLDIFLRHCSSSKSFLLNCFIFTVSLCISSFMTHSFQFPVSSLSTMPCRAQLHKKQAQIFPLFIIFHILHYYLFHDLTLFLVFSQIHNKVFYFGARSLLVAVNYSKYFFQALMIIS